MNPYHTADWNTKKINIDLINSIFEIESTGNVIDTNGFSVWQQNTMSFMSFIPTTAVIIIMGNCL